MEEAAANDPLIGVTIGNFEVKSKLGEGGMGSVYLAEHPLIGKKVAIKVLHQEFSSNEDMTRRFFVEAKAVADIGHPNIVDIVDYGYIPQGGHKTVYFIMEFLGGNSLAHVIRSSAPLPPERALAIALQVADALSTSHQHDIVHRDLKPDNVMLIQRGRETDFVKVLDFGIAKLTGDQQGSGRTRTGIVMGTPAYMSPEQCEGRGNIDHRTDIYALGILLYEMLTGQVPFKGEGYGEVLVKHLTQLPMRPSMIMPVIPPHVEAVVMKALEKHPQNRYPTMEEFMKALVDPVGYVEAHGGIAAFLSNTFTPSAPGVYQTPYQTQVPGNLMVPGSGAVMSPLVIPGSGAMPAGMYPSVPGVPGHTTLGTGNGQVADGRGGGLHVGIIAAVAAVILVLGGGAFMLFGRGDDKPATDTVIAQPDGLPPGESPPVDANGDNPPGGDVVEPTPEPPVEPEVVEPEKVLIKVASRPEGASVYVADETEPRGVTPVSFELVKGAGEVPMILKLDGYKDEPRTLVPDRPREMDLSLRRDRSASSKSSDSSTKSTDTKSTKTGKVKNDVGLEEPEW